eukprot:m.97438 g.97438  ORF g.97438 m.97438 type:complete len:865 (+) comp13595_c0_seq5:351-2945(+)
MNTTKLINDTLWEYCGEYPPVTPVWVDHGVSPCFQATLASTISFGLALGLGGVQSAMMKPKPRKEGKFENEGIVVAIYVLSNLLISLTFVADLVLTIVLQKRSTEYIVVCDTLHAAAWTAIALQIRGRYKRGHIGVGVVTYMIWVIALASMTVTFISYKSPHVFFVTKSTLNSSRLILFMIQAVCVVGCMSISITVFLARWQTASMKSRESNHYETAPLLVNDGVKEGGEAEKNQTTEGDKEDKKKDKSVKQRTGSTFRDIGKKVKILWPCLWPVGKPLLQLRVIICIMALVATRVVNVLVPVFYKHVVDKLSPQNGPLPDKIPFPAKEIMLYVLLRFLQGGGIGSMGLLANIRTFLWIDVQQYTNRTIRVKLFHHFHAQDLKWHLNRKTGEVLRMMDRGGDSVNNLLNYILFNIAPTLADIAIAVTYFTTTFGSYFGLIVFTTMGGYIWFTVAVTEWRTKFRRNMNTRDNAVRQKATDSLLNAETVKLYCGEQFEVDSFRDKVLDFQVHEWYSISTLSLLNTGQSLIITSGLAAGSLLAGYMVSVGELTLGDFVLFITYLVQLYAPLNWFGTYFRMIQAALVDMENMMDLLDIEPSVVDLPGATALALESKETDFKLVFKDVHFSYHPEKPILRGVSFEVNPGDTVAIVGSTGGGKSTIMRLLFRFYDVDSGDILFNGKSIKNFTIKSCRQACGVVPQDTVLFNETIRYNLRYGAMHASDDEVLDASRSAEIHNSILEFPDQYQTAVGERGLKLSGGEKQRVAIARTMLKKPNIVLLDEATSALDTETERAIQASLKRLCKNRTTVVIAHRLSTVINADKILVLSHGQIAEQGVHSDLLAQGGLYAEMWNAQLDNINDQEDSK